MTNTSWNNMIEDDEEFSEFSEYEINKSNKDRERRNSKMMKKQYRLKQKSMNTDNTGINVSHGY